MIKDAVLTIETDSIDTNNEKRDAHLKSAEKSKLQNVLKFHHPKMLTKSFSRFGMCGTIQSIILNRANRVLAVYAVYTEGITGTVADPKLMFTTALKANAVSLVLSHNHPSSKLKPSRADEDLTGKIKKPVSRDSKMTEPT